MHAPLAWSPDNKLFAAGDDRGYVRIWNIPDEEEILKYRGHESVKAVLWSLDRKSIFSAGTEGTIQKWNIQTGRKELTLKGHPDSVNSLALAPSGKYIASGSDDRTVIIWNLESGKQYFKYTDHTSNVHQVSWSPSSTLIASADNSKSVQIWDVSKKEEVYTYFHRVESVVWSPDGSSIASGKAHENIEIWDPYSGNTISRYGSHLSIKNAPAGVFAWSPDGICIACSTFEEIKGNNGTTSLVANKVHIWDVTSGEVPFVYEGHSDTVVAIVWSPDGKYIASSSRGGTIQIWLAISTHQCSQSQIVSTVL